MGALRPLVILGAGGFARGVLDVVDALNAVQPSYRFLGFLAPAAAGPQVLDRGAAVIGPDAALEDLDADYLIGIADPHTRRRLDRYARDLGRTAAVAVHPAATAGACCHVGPGSVLTAGVRLASNVVLGRHTHANLNVTMGHDARTGDYVTLFPQAAISGAVTVGAGATIGSASVVIQGVHVGAQSTVGAGAAVIRDVADGVTVAGVPARAIGAGAGRPPASAQHGAGVDLDHLARQRPRGG